MAHSVLFPFTHHPVSHLHVQGYPKKLMENAYYEKVVYKF